MLQLRKGLGVFANLRPAIVFPQVNFYNILSLLHQTIYKEIASSRFIFTLFTKKLHAQFSFLLFGLWSVIFRITRLVSCQVPYATNRCFGYLKTGESCLVWSLIDSLVLCWILGYPLANSIVNMFITAMGKFEALQMALFPVSLDIWINKTWSDLMFVITNGLAYWSIRLCK